MGEKTGSFGSVTYDGDTLNIESNSNTLGGIALTSGEDRIECYFDGTQWVCNSINFGPTPSSQD
jgi:hypothetical protein